MFQITALDFLQTGYDPINNVKFQSLADVVQYFPVGAEGRAKAYIMTPQNELDDSVTAGSGNADLSVYYIQGLLYKDKIDQLTDRIKSLIRGIPVIVQTYQALNSEDPAVARLFDTRRGKALFQYDPRAKSGRTPSGARLFLEGKKKYNEFWSPEVRLLSGPESQNQPLLSCAGQAYEDNKVRSHHSFRFSF
jgi:hypothetical protein